MPPPGPPEPAPIAYLPWDRYTECIRTDTDRLLEVAAPALQASVPSCPGWTVEDLVRHVARVYLHKVECMRRASAPAPWPPEGLETREPLGLLEEATESLLAELAARDPYEERFTWWEPDQTNGFWYRRMALEIAVHRFDGELARVADLGPDIVTPVPEDIALDGIDEILSIMLGGPWWEGDFHTSHPIDAEVRVTAAGQSWSVEGSAAAVVVSREADSDVQAEIAGEPSDVFLWLWGRGPLDALSVTGERGLADELRARIVEAD